MNPTMYTMPKLRELLGPANHIEMTRHSPELRLVDHAIMMITRFKGKGRDAERDYYLNADTPTAYTVRERSTRLGLCVECVVNCLLDEVFGKVIDPNDFEWWNTKI